MSAPFPSPLPLSSVYVCDEGHRHAEPVFYNFFSGAKARWKGRSILDVFTSEFDSNSPEYFARAISIGAITSCGKRVPCDHVLGDGDRLVHRVHRHEPPVSAERVVRVPVERDDSPDGAAAARLVAVSKPGGVPVHSCGPYNALTVVSLLCRSEGVPPTSFHTVHRLDRLTSGVLLLAEDKGTAALVSTQLREGRVEKRYLAVVEGRFPDCPAPAPSSPRQHSDAVDAVSTSACEWLPTFTPRAVMAHWRVDGEEAKAREAGTESSGGGGGGGGGGGTKKKRPRQQAEEGEGLDGDDALAPPPPLRCCWTVSAHLRVDVPCVTVDSKNALHGVVDGGANRGGEGDARESCTLFRKVGERREGDGTVLSLVECRPLSGRTHQIRVHLAWLGFPIADDPVYNARAGERVRGGRAPTSTNYEGTRGGGDVGGGEAPPPASALRPCELAGVDLASGVQDRRERQATGAESLGGAVHGEGAGSDGGTGQATDAAILSLCPNCRLGPAAYFTPLQLACPFGISLASVEYAGPGWRVQGHTPRWADNFTAHGTRGEETGGGCDGV